MGAADRPTALTALAETDHQLVTGEQRRADPATGSGLERQQAVRQCERGAA